MTIATLREIGKSAGRHVLRCVACAPANGRGGVDLEQSAALPLPHAI